jgi:tRNA pseudouridine38-40 synthase
MLTVSYDGTNFAGWQRQSKGQTIQGLIEEALGKLCGHQVTLYGSGRTDAGVHARAQTANFFTNSNRQRREIINGGNAMLPETVAILRAQEVARDFNARFSAQGKTYSYDFLISKIRDPLLVNRAWFVGPNLDWSAVRQSLPSLLGTQDFKSFGSAGSEVKNTVRNISRADLTEPSANLVRLTLTGSGFLRHMVRTIAGTLWLIGRHKLTPTELEVIIASQDRSRAGPVAPARGLYLEEVHY